MSDKSLETLIKYFPTGTAEGEQHLLQKIFVNADELAELVVPAPYSPRLLVGKKGTGKSALVSFLQILLEHAKIPSLVLLPSDIDYENFEEDASIGQLTRAARDALLRSIAVRLGETQAGLVTGEDVTLYRESINHGAREADIVSKAASLLPRIAKPVSYLDFKDLLPEQSRATRIKIERSVSTNLKKSSKSFFLCVDDTDQLAAPQKSGHLNRIWAFLLAARKLAGDIPELRCTVTLREEVWQRLIHDKAGQRDQTDHFLPLVKTLSPSRKHVREIIERRIALAASDIGYSGTSPWLGFFEGARPHMPLSEKRTGWSDAVIVRSRDRPRDAVQLILGCAERAKEAGDEKISEDTFASEMKSFSLVRKRLLAQENEHECPNLSQILDSFASIDFDHGPFKATSEVIRKHITSLTGAFGITLFGKTVNPENREDAFNIWSFLYQIGFLNARTSDKRESDKYRHIFPQDNATLVSEAEWNNMQKLVWEIHPAYRDYIILVRGDRAAQFGLPPNKHGKRRR